MSILNIVKTVKEIHKEEIIFVKIGKFYQVYGKDVNVKSFCSFLAKKYVGFWQRVLEGEIPLF